MNNDKVRILKDEVLSDNYYVLRKLTFDYTKNDGSTEKQVREAYDRGNGAVILLYNRNSRKILLTRQFRLPTYINGNSTGMLIEACAGLLDKDNPETAIIRETEEETGYKIKKVTKLFEAYMSPGSVTELLYFFAAEYDKSMKVSEGGGHHDEQENIEVLELPFNDTIDMIRTGEIKDAKTIMLIQYAALHKLLD